MITVVGSCNTDFTVRTERLPSIGETIVGDEVFVCGGGKGANQATCIARLGGEACFISNIGLDHFGKISIKNLNNIGVGTGFIKRDRRHRSGAAFIIVDRCGRNLITVSPGSNKFLKLTDILEREGCIKNSDIVLAQLEIPLEVVRAAFGIAKRFKKTTILNPAPAQRLNKDILSKVDILIPNEGELKILAGKGPLVNAARLLLKKGAGCVIITLGKKGALLVTKEKARLFKTKKVKAVDTTCAGDAFCGALALGLDKGWSLEDSIEFANATAALTVTKLGAQSSLPTMKEVKKFCSL